MLGGGRGAGASGGGKPPEAQAGGLCWVAMAYGFGERTDRGAAHLFHLEKLLYPQLIPSSSKGLDLTTLIYRGWVRRYVITHDPALLGSCQKVRKQARYQLLGPFLICFNPASETSLFSDSPSTRGKDWKILPRGWGEGRERSQICGSLTGQ